MWSLCSGLGEDRGKRIKLQFPSQHTLVAGSSDSPSKVDDSKYFLFFQPYPSLISHYTENNVTLLSCNEHCGCKCTSLQSKNP